MIRREIGDDKVCLLTFDRPESGANIFDAATLSELNEHVDLIEKDSSLRGLIITSAKKSIFIAGADLKTLLKQAQTGGVARVHRRRATHFQSHCRAKDPDVRGDSWRLRRRRL